MLQRGGAGGRSDVVNVKVESPLIPCLNTVIIGRTRAKERGL